MPLKNVDHDWDAWLIDDLGAREEEYQKVLIGLLVEREIPKCEISKGYINMWGRKDSRGIDVVSNLDGKVTCSIHILHYGTSLWVGRAIASGIQSRYYQQMATAAFIRTIDRCILDTTLTMTDSAAMHEVADTRLK